MDREEKLKRTYIERTRVLKSMGFSSYRDYLAGELWQKIRSDVLEADPDCYICGDPATQVHHGKYIKRVLEGRDLRHLYPLCRSCHHEIEFRNRDHAKLTPQQARTKMNLLRILHKRKQS